MLRNYLRSFALASYLVAFSPIGQTQEIQEEPNGPAELEQDLSATLPFPIPVQIVESPEALKARERIEANARERAERDLYAQEGMNSATERMAGYAFWQTVMVLLGTVALIWTLLITRQANKAAFSAVEVTERYGAAQTRAYISVSAIYMGSGPPPIKPTTGIRFEYTNTGTTPARLLTLGGSFDRFGLGEQLEEHSPRPQEVYAMDLGAQGSDFAHCSAIDEEGRAILRDFLDGKSGLVVTFFVEYDDVFRRRFRYRLTCSMVPGANAEKAEYYDAVSEEEDITKEHYG